MSITQKERSTFAKILNQLKTELLAGKKVADVCAEYGVDKKTGQALCNAFLSLENGNAGMNSENTLLKRELNKLAKESKVMMDMLTTSPMM